MRLSVFKSLAGTKTLGAGLGLLLLLGAAPFRAQTPPPENGSGEIMVKGWGPTTDKAAGYNLYCSLSPDSGFKKVNTSAPITDASYLVQGLDWGRRYYFKITQVSKDLPPVESVPSAVWSMLSHPPTNDDGLLVQRLRTDPAINPFGNPRHTIHADSGALKKLRMEMPGMSPEQRRKLAYRFDANGRQALDENGPKSRWTAVGCFEIAHELVPRDGEALYLLGYAEQRVGLYEKALACLTTSAETNPDEPRLNWFIGLTWYHLGFYDKALVYLREMMADNPKHYRSAMLAGRILFREKDYRDALLYFDAFDARTVKLDVAGLPETEKTYLHTMREKEAFYRAAIRRSQASVPRFQ